MIKHFLRVFNTLVGDLPQILSMINLFSVSRYVVCILVCFDDMKVKCSSHLCSLRGDVWT